MSGSRRRKSRIRFLMVPTADVWREPVWASNDLLATVVRLRAMLDREENTTGRIYLTPSAVRALTGAGKVDRAWRILQHLAEIGIIEVERIATPGPGGSAGQDRVDLVRSGRSSRRSAHNRRDLASILDRKWPEMLGLGERLDRQSRGGLLRAPPTSQPEPRRNATPGLRQLDRPGMARRSPGDLERMAEQSAAARAAIDRAAARWARPTRARQR